MGLFSNIAGKVAGRMSGDKGAMVQAGIGIVQ